MSRTVMPGSRPAYPACILRFGSFPPPAPCVPDGPNTTRKRYSRARETDVAKCMIVEVEWYTPPAAAWAPAEPVQCSSDEVSHFRAPEVGRRATALPSG